LSKLKSWALTPTYFMLLSTSTFVFSTIFQSFANIFLLP
jgi:hypothetical protein